MKTLAGTEQDLKGVRQTCESKDKQLRAETLMRRQLEQQVDRLANREISQRLARASMENVARNSLETPIVSPDPLNQRVHQSTSCLYYQ